jgi:hypothetical protein
VGCGCGEKIGGDPYAAPNCPAVVRTETETPMILQPRALLRRRWYVVDESAVIAARFDFRSIGTSMSRERDKTTHNLSASMLSLCNLIKNNIHTVSWGDFVVSAPHIFLFIYTEYSIYSFPFSPQPYSHHSCAFGKNNADIHSRVRIDQSMERSSYFCHAAFFLNWHSRQAFGH